MTKETIEEFLSRGGNIITEKVKSKPSWELNEPIDYPIIGRSRPTIQEYYNSLAPKRDYSNKEFENQLHDFYHSKEWKSIRETVHKQLTQMCPVCGNEHNLIVDHIKPIRYFWELRLTLDNLQVLCGDCNLEKGSIPNWNLSWHIRNKEYLTENRLLVEYSIKEKERKELDKKAYSGLENWKIEEFKRYYSSYSQLAKNKKLNLLPKLKFRKIIEEQFPSDTWRNTNKIKRWIKENFTTQFTEQT
jgi:5-methylcytosine-specific restriction endonuclease McrA